MSEKKKSIKMLLYNKRVIFTCSILITVSMLIIIMAVTDSRFRDQHVKVADNELQTFYAAARIYSSSGEEIPLSSEVVQGKTKRYFQVPADEFDGMKVRLSYKGEAKNYVRMKMDISWLRRNAGNPDNYDLILHEVPGYQWVDPDSVYDNRISDNWIYFKNPMGESDSETTIDVISMTLAHQDVQDPVEVGDKAEFARIYITLDCVQYNRVNELWNMAQLPWM